MITHAGCWENTRKACKSLAFGSWFTSFSRDFIDKKVIFCKSFELLALSVCHLSHCNDLNSSVWASMRWLSSWLYPLMSIMFNIVYAFTGTLNQRFFNQSERAYYLSYFIKKQYEKEPRYKLRSLVITDIFCQSLLPFISRFHCTYFYLFIFQKVVGPGPPAPPPARAPPLGFYCRANRKL